MEAPGASSAGPGAPSISVRVAGNPDERGTIDATPAPAPPPTIAAGWTFCDENAERAREMAVKYIGGYWATALRHYEMAADHFGKAKGYEYYEQMAKTLQGHGADAAIEYFLNLQVWGTPEMCLRKIDDIRRRVNADHFVGVFSYAGMPIEDAERSLRLFAREVMPELKKLNGVQSEAA